MTTNINPTLITFFTLIEQEDGEALESARDLVRLEHFPALVDYYWKQTNWYRKAGVIDLLQDTITPISQPVMRDFLRAPADTQGDWLDINKVVAVCHLEGNLGLFDKYYHNPQLTAERVRAHLGEAKAAVAPTPPPAPTRLRISKGGWVSIGAIVFLILLFGGLGWLAVRENNRFLREGVRVTAGVVHMEENTWADPEQRYRVVYLFDAGELDFVTDSDYVTAEEWAKAEATEEIEVVFLPDYPEINVAAHVVDQPLGVLLIIAFGVPMLFAVLLVGQATAEYLALTQRIRWQPKTISFWEKR